jgi:hypothetical protein
MPMSNICRCPKPPGGQVVCSDRQLAICGYRDGEIVSGCYDPPLAVAWADPGDARQAMHNWVLSAVTGMERELDAPLTKTDAAILAAGRYVSANGDEVRFVAPRELDENEPRLHVRTM